MAFEIRVPTGSKGTAAPSKGGTGDSSATEKPMRETNKLLKKLDKTMILNIDVVEIITSLFSDVVQLFRPLIKILSLLFLVIFLPILPLIVLLVKGFAALIKVFTGGFGGVAKTIGKVIIGLILIVLGLLLAIFAGPALAIAAGVALVVAGFIAFGSEIWNFIKLVAGFVVNLAKIVGSFLAKVFKSIPGLIKKAWEFIKAAFMWYVDTFIAFWTGVFDFIKDLGPNIWEAFVNGLKVVANFGVWIWDKFVDGLKGIANLGTKIWNWIKDQLGSIGNFFSGSSEQDFVMRPGQGPVSFSPQDTLVGVKDVSQLGGGGSNVTINVNNPVVRDETGVRKMTDAISRELQRRGNRGFSGI